jgi:hypothetical protein
MIEIDTESTLYVCTDGANAELHLLVPKGRKFTDTEHLRLDDPDPYGPHGSDAAVFKLLCESDMEHHTFDI